MVIRRWNGSRICRWLWLAFILLALGCGGGGSDSGDPVPSPTPTRPPGVLSISASIRTEPTPADINELIARYLEAFDLAQGAGANGQFSSYTWADLEPTNGDYRLDDLQSAIEHVEAEGLTLLLGLQVINTVARAVPPDLEDVQWNAVLMRTRMRALLDRIFPIVQGHVSYISIGNEVDVYFEPLSLAQAAEFQAYIIFFEETREYIRANLPGVQVGVTFTAGGLLGAHGAEWAELNDRADALVATYYPLNADFTVRAPDRPLTDFAALAQTAGDKPVVLQEVGYPAATLIGSSENRQAQFISYVFEAWRAADGQIPFLNLFLLHDFSQEQLDWLGPFYGLDDNANFMAYLATLGLRRADGQARVAWDTLLEGSAAAGLR